ncbi:DUF4177 domain-containing protein [Haladaptatus sp. W1]|uniref:DUF4177 domain-containing protein n=1 Tax=Haladaptatus sp. W1 TaxID=1897478 RepID=UPI0009F69109
MSPQYEYKTIKSTKKWLGLMTDRTITEQRLNRLAQEGWELDQVTTDWTGILQVLVLRRPKQ